LSFGSTDIHGEVRLLDEKYPCNRPWRPWVLWDIEASTFFRQSTHRWRWGCQPYAPVGRPLPPEKFLVLIYVHKREHFDGSRRGTFLCCIVFAARVKSGNENRVVCPSLTPHFQFTTVRPLFNDRLHQCSTLSASKQHWPPVTFWPNPLQVLCFMYTTRMFISAFVRFDVVNWNEDLTTVLHSSARTASCYITRKSYQGSLNSCHIMELQVGIHHHNLLVK
jgi:hypothetical protein